ncbi:nuclear transport factor 2 family protein [Sphingomonas sp. Sphisp140]|uniref:nuclear transport factor 2 family protein n=1 Tax=unclassified Sphingomonas TaxID=196159 RepID=UPI0039AF893E
MTTPAIVSAVIAAVNGGNLPGFLDLFDTMGVVDDWGSVYRGHEAIRAWSDRELIGVAANFTLKDAQQHGDTAWMRVQVGGNGFTGPSRFAFAMHDGRIVRMTITAD